MRAIKARHLQVELVQPLNVAGRDHGSHRFERLLAHAQREPAGKAVSHDLAIGGGTEEPHHARLRVAGGAGERVLHDSDARHAEVIYRE